MNYKISVFKEPSSTVIRLHEGFETRINDGSYPNQDFGYLCFRHVHKWLVSGFIDSRIAKTQTEVDELIYKLSQDQLGLDDCLSLKVSVVNIENTLLENGEEDESFC